MRRGSAGSDKTENRTSPHREDRVPLSLKACATARTITKPLTARTPKIATVIMSIAVTIYTQVIAIVTEAPLSLSKAQ